MRQSIVPRPLSCHLDDVQSLTKSTRVWRMQWIAINQDKYQRKTWPVTVKGQERVIISRQTRPSSKNTSYTPRFVNQTLGGCFDENCPNFKTLLQCKQNFGLGLTLAGAIARIGATNRNAWLSRNMFLSPTKGLCSKRWYPLRSVTAVINLLTSYFIYHCRFRSIPFLYQKNVPWRAD